MRTSSPIIPSFRPFEHKPDQIHAQNRHNFTFCIMSVTILQMQRETADYTTWFQVANDLTRLPCHMIFFKCLDDEHEQRGKRRVKHWHRRDGTGALQKKPHKTKPHLG